MFFGTIIDYIISKVQCRNLQRISKFVLSIVTFPSLINLRSYWQNNNTWIWVPIQYWFYFSIFDFYMYLILNWSAYSPEESDIHRAKIHIAFTCNDLIWQIFFIIINSFHYYKYILHYYKYIFHYDKYIFHYYEYISYNYEYIFHYYKYIFLSSSKSSHDPAQKTLVLSKLAIDSDMDHLIVNRKQILHHNNYRLKKILLSPDIIAILLGHDI